MTEIVATEPASRTWLRRAGVAALLLVFFGSFWLAISRTKTGDSGVAVSGAADVATILSPQNGDTVVNQQAQISIKVDLRYNATLSINGIVLPDDQVTKLPQAGGTQYLFNPGAGKAVEVLPAGQNTVQASFSRVDGTAEVVAPVIWRFRVA